MLEEIYFVIYPRMIDKKRFLRYNIDCVISKIAPLRPKRVRGEKIEDKIRNEKGL